MTVTIAKANLEAPAFVDLINTHAQLMLSLSQEESCHFLPIEGLKSDAVTVWELRSDEVLVGCGALQQLIKTHGEIKSMHTLSSHRGGGFGRQMLEHILAEARRRNYLRLSLETGSMEGFRPARTLYETYGFVACEPFGSYTNDPLSCFMTLEL